MHRSGRCGKVVRTAQGTVQPRTKEKEGRGYVWAYPDAAGVNGVGF